MLLLLLLRRHHNRPGYTQNIVPANTRFVSTEASCLISRILWKSKHKSKTVIWLSIKMNVHCIFDIARRISLKKTVHIAYAEFDLRSIDGSSSQHESTIALRNPCSSVYKRFPFGNGASFTASKLHGILGRASIPAFENIAPQLCISTRKWFTACSGMEHVRQKTISFHAVSVSLDGYIFFVDPGKSVGTVRALLLLGGNPVIWKLSGNQVRRKQKL